MINADWHRYIIGAILRHFESSRGTNYVYFPGHAIDKRDDSSSWVELRIVGPDIRETSKGAFEINVEVDCLVQANLRSNIYGFYNLAGEVASWLTCINVIDDDDIYLCTLELDMSGTSNGVITTPFGIERNQQHQLGTVIGTYKAYIDT